VAIQSPASIRHCAGLALRQAARLPCGRIQTESCVSHQKLCIISTVSQPDLSSYSWGTRGGADVTGDHELMRDTEASPAHGRKRRRSRGGVEYAFEFT
jgi:hypothetical protein